MKNCLRVAISVTCLFHLNFSGAGELHQIKDVLEPIPDLWNRLPGLSVQCEIDDEWNRAFLEYRESSGYPMQIAGTRNIGIYEYETNGTFFKYDHRSRWENGAVCLNESGAWDGSLWQKLDRVPDSGNVLEVARVRRGIHENGSHAASPFAWAFPFLTPASPDAGGTGFRDDEFELSPTLEVVGSRQSWIDAFRRVKEQKYEINELDGIKCVVINIDTGVATGDRSSPVISRVWFPLEHPAFPKRVEVRDLRTNRLMTTYEVEEFQKVGGVFSFPKEAVAEAYTPDPGFPDAPYKTTRISYSKIEIVDEFEKDEFTFDPLTAKEVKSLDTGKRILVKD